MCTKSGRGKKMLVMLFSVKLSRIARLRPKKSGKCEKNLWGEKQVLDSFTSLTEALSRAKSALSLSLSLSLRDSYHRLIL